MQRPAFFRIEQALLGACALGVCWWAGMPWPGLVGLAGLTALAMILEPRQPRWVPVKECGVLLMLCGIAAGAWQLYLDDKAFLVQEGTRPFFAYFALLVVLAMFWIPPARPREPGQRLLWIGRLAAAMPVALCAGGLWLAWAFELDLVWVFRAGIVAGVIWLVRCKRLFALPGWATQAVNTAILVLVGIPLVDTLVPAPGFLRRPYVSGRKYYTYEAAKKDPAAFGRWWPYFMSELNQNLLPDLIQIPGPHGLPSALKPNSRGKFFDCEIRINRLGFRGDELAPKKGNVYRIVALGESTTFGLTQGATDQPWPDLLERLIVERLKPARPVEVVNAGVPAWTLTQNLSRIDDILALKPDLILCYHGYNGFKRLVGPAGRPRIPPPPDFKPRAVKLLANCEYRYRLMKFHRRAQAAMAKAPMVFTNLTQTRAAERYRTLIQIAKTNGIPLAIGNFCMAVNDQSPDEVVDFFQPGFPLVRWEIQANLAHEQLVQALAKESPNVVLIDTHPHLDGDHEKFVDLVHLTEAGRQQLAENFFAGLEPMLRKTLLGEHSDSSKTALRR